MLCHVRHRLGCLVLLLLVIQGLVVSGVGETLAHGLETAAEASHTHGATSHQSSSHHTEGREQSAEYSPLHFDGGSHFHESADRLAMSTLPEPILADSLQLGERGGSPLRRMFRLERPPRLSIAV
ncbi:MAG: hypothetical protein HLUCCA13_02590 [Halomonas sp. HL-48]|nr:MAG: hypothetical protein HLUCCA13_02590 [Halomonas sp. HL-48]